VKFVSFKSGDSRRGRGSLGRGRRGGRDRGEEADAAALRVRRTASDAVEPSPVDDELIEELTGDGAGDGVERLMPRRCTIRRNNPGSDEDAEE
jgi:hypothetical protein